MDNASVTSRRGVVAGYHIFIHLRSQYFFCFFIVLYYFCHILINVMIICYVCSIRLLRLVTPLSVYTVCSCLHFLIESALLLVCIFYHSCMRIKDEGFAAV